MDEFEYGYDCGYSQGRQDKEAGKPRFLREGDSDYLQGYGFGYEEGLAE